MKKIPIFFLIISLSTQAFSQYIDDYVYPTLVPKTPTEEMMQKSEDQKTGAIVLGVISLDTSSFALYQFTQLYTTTKTGPIIALTAVSLAVLTGCIALLIASKKLKAKAEAMMQENPQPPGTTKATPGQTTIIMQSPFKHSAFPLLRKTSIGTSNDRINAGYLKRQTKINSLVLAILIGK